MQFDVFNKEYFEVRKTMKEIKVNLIFSREYA